MRRYSDPVHVRSGVLTSPTRDTDSGAPTNLAPTNLAPSADRSEPTAFIWQGRLYVVHRVLGHWRERRLWWRDALDPAPGQPTGIDVASREQHVWRVEASRGQAYGVGVFDLTSDGAEGADADWRLVGVAD